MSLGKLLSTGRSLIGGAPGEGRYNISNVNRLPKFGSVKNPFAPSAPSEAVVARASRPCEQELTGETPVPLTSRPDCEVVEARIAEFVKHSENICGATEEISEMQAERPLTTAISTSEGERDGTPAACVEPMNRGSGRESAPTSPGIRWSGLTSAATKAVVVNWLKTFWRVARAGAVAAFTFIRGIKWRAALQVCRSMTRVAWDNLKFISLKLAGLFRRREQQEPKPLFPRFGKSVVQAELSLDSIKVVRNTLEDSDLEIVTSKTRTSTQIAPTTPVAQPKRGPVPAALKKMTGIIAGPKAG